MEIKKITTIKLNEDRGSLWRKWDLHLHSPGSFDYKNKLVTNDDIVAALVDKNIEAAIITDHNTFDVARIKELQEIGKKKGVVIFPGIELRGDKRHKSPINLIGIFSDESNLDHIASELLTRLDINKQRNDGRKEEEIYVNTFDSCDLIHQLGGIVTVHAGGKSNSIEECYPNALPVNVAEKLDLIEKIDIFEVGVPQDILNYRDKVFPNIGRVLPTIKTSDNHDAATYEFKDDAYCWIKADLTFEGLKQIIYEPLDRVYVGLRPPVLTRVAANKTRYIKSLTISQNDGYNNKQGIWFKDVNINLNSELIAIIGNKGSGKSALSDIVGLLGNTLNAGEKHVNFSFLSVKNPKFRKKGYAENFHSEMVWQDGSGEGKKVTLNTDIDINNTEKVKYLPQNYFETLTNDLNGDGFDKTLESVIYLHIPESQRLDTHNFNELEATMSQNIEADLSILKEEIKLLSENVIKLEMKSHPDYAKRMKNLLAQKQNELIEHEKNKPKPVPDPSSNKEGSGEQGEQKQREYRLLTQLNTLFGENSTKIEDARSNLNKITKDKQELVLIKDSIARHRNQIEDYINSVRGAIEGYGLNPDDILTVKYNPESIITAITSKNSEIASIGRSLRSEQDIENDTALITTEAIEEARSESLIVIRTNLQSQIDTLKKALTQPEKDFQEYKELLAKWNTRKTEIEGSKDLTSTLLFYKNEDAYISKQLVNDLVSARQERENKVIELLRKKKETVDLYTKFKQSIDGEISKDKDFSNKFSMQIDVNFKLDKDFADDFLRFINKSRKGSFLGATDKTILDLFNERDLLNESDIISLINEIIDRLEFDYREDDPKDEARQISDQIERIQDFYDFIFSLDYLRPIYELKLDNKTLDELSPGEKGTLLLVFYLMIDKEDTPLVIDQPEDNLDNKSVYQVLTHFIKLAKRRRQIIIVTHNPNLAVGADAEQIIYVELNKKAGKNEFIYETGAIENPAINARIVEILEGTMPAFDKRKLRYNN